MKKKPTQLSQEALADLTRSGLDAADADALGIRDKSQMQTLMHYGAPVRSYGIPYYQPTADKTFVYERARLLETYKKPHWKRPRKYTQPSKSKPELYCPTLKNTRWDKILPDVKQPLFITEGEKKAAAATKAGYPCIGLGGVWNWQSKGAPLPQWNDIALEKREVFIVFDSDIIDKPEVKRAERALAAFLTECGAIVRRVRLPSAGSDKVGFDDFLVQHGFPEKPKAARAAFDALAREEIDLLDLGERLTDTGNARRFARINMGEVAYVLRQKHWIIYDPAKGTWRVDEDGEIMRRAKITAAMIFEDAKNAGDERIQKIIKKWAHTSEGARGLKSMIELAASEPDMSIKPDYLDSDAWVIATGDGMAIDLKLGMSRPAAPDDYFTKSLGTSLQPDASCPTWDKFLRDIMKGDEDMIGFIQRAVGYTLTGDDSEQCLFFSWGQGSNGKSTFQNILLALFGSYGTQCAPETLLVNKQQSSIRNDIARLRGARLITTSEAEDGQWLAESLIKQLTGGDTIVARKLYQEHSEFKMQGKIWMATNYKPRIRGTDYAIWRRILLIPFNETFTPEQQDKNLKEKLLAELPGILNWALRGCAEWLKEGLQPPPNVIAATEEYRVEMDVLGAWIEQNCEVNNENEECKELASILYTDYSDWCKECGTYPMSRHEFTRRMQDRGYKKKDTSERTTDKKGRFLVGIRRKQSASAPTQRKFTR